MRAEDFIKDYTKGCSNELVYEEPNHYNPWLTPEQALKAVEIARDEYMERAYAWLKANFRISSFDNTKIVTNFASMDDLLKSFKYAMRP